LVSVPFMDDGFAFNAVTVILLDHRGAVGGFTLLDDRSGTVTIAIPIIIPMAFADCYASPDRANPNAYFFRQSRGGQRGNRSNRQNVLVKLEEKSLLRPGVPDSTPKCRGNFFQQPMDCFVASLLAMTIN
jgi:hypothetical protein